MKVEKVGDKIQIKGISVVCRLAYTRFYFKDVLRNLPFFIPRRVKELMDKDEKLKKKIMKVLNLLYEIDDLLRSKGIGKMERAYFYPMGIMGIDVMDKSEIETALVGQSEASYLQKLVEGL